jgi:hypothetical protein
MRIVTAIPQSCSPKLNGPALRCYLAQPEVCSRTVLAGNALAQHPPQMLSRSRST